MFRVTNKMISDKVMYDLTLNIRKLDTLFEKLSTGKELNRPSDNPIDVTRALQHRTSINNTDQYMKNMEMAISWLNFSDSALDDIDKILIRVKELAVQGATESNSQQSRYAIGEEIKSLADEALNVANSSYAGRYIFGGYKTVKDPREPFEIPFDLNTYNYKGDSGKMEIEIDKSVKITYNLTGREVFVKGDKTLFQVLRELGEAMEGMTQLNTERIEEKMGEVDDWIDHILKYRAIIGARVNRLERAKSRMLDLNINTQKLLSQREDLDLPKTVSDLKTQEAVYQAALSAASKVLQPTLLDFLR
ncbi:MAG TPA: flagellar hook-associated protein 3 [Candidatus Atribacteria bacterium]|nr:flagellar hook-associated protein 3 [Candidatus Atribacteria bacterium]